MKSLAERILYRKSALIFEQLGFLLPHPECSQSPDNKETSAIVQFEGPFSGYLSLRLSSDVVRQLSCNMLADDRKSSEVLQKDTVGEIANIICGNSLPAIFGFERAFRLKTPSTGCDRKLESLERFSQAVRVQIPFETGNAEVELFVDSTALTQLPG